MLAAVAGTAGQPRKTPVTDNVDSFVWVRANRQRGWKRATGVDVFAMWATFAWERDKTSARSHVPRREDGQQLKVQAGRTMREAILGSVVGYRIRVESRMCVDETARSARRLGLRGETAQPSLEPSSIELHGIRTRESRRAGVRVKQAPTLIAVQVRNLVLAMRRRLSAPATAAARMAMTGHSPFLFGFAHDDARVCSCGRSDDASGRQRRVHRKLSVQKGVAVFLSSGCDTENLDCREVCAVSATLLYSQAAASIRWSLEEKAGASRPSVMDDGTMGALAMSTA